MATDESEEFSDACLPLEKPTPAGLYRYITWAFLFHAYGLIYILSDWGGNMKGPFSEVNPIIEEQPGPPLSHRIKGSLSF